jgi:hypothetical protein
MAVRLIFFLLVFANLIFFAWSQGYFGEGDPNREPDRLNQQLQAEKLRLLPSAVPGPTPAPAPPAASNAEDLACRIVGGLGMANAEALKVAALAAGAEAQLMPQVEPTLYLVVISDLPNAAAAEKKAAELKRFGVVEQETVALNGGRQEIILGRLPTEAAAREALAALNKRGIKSARVDPRDQPPVKARVELRGTPANLLQRLPQLIAPYADASVTDCAK